MRAELVAQAQAGDHEAFSALAHGASARLYATARLIMREPHHAEDAVQDTLVTAWRDIRGLRDPDRLEAWLHRILVRACQRHLRKERRLRVVELGLPAWHDARTPDAIQAVAERDEIERAFRRLTPEQRTVLALVYYADLPLADVAIALGVPLGTVKSRLHRAVEALRASLVADRRLLGLAEGQVAS